LPPGRYPGYIYALSERQQNNNSEVEVKTKFSLEGAFLISAHGSKRLYLASVIV
jgi:hypothetical protein